MAEEKVTVTVEETPNPEELREQAKSLEAEAERIETARKKGLADAKQRREEREKKQQDAAFEKRVEYWKSGILKEPSKQPTPPQREPAWIRNSRWPICPCGQGKLVPSNTLDREEPPWDRTVHLQCNNSCGVGATARYNSASGKFKVELNDPYSTAEYY